MTSFGLDNQDWTTGIDMPRMREQRKERARKLMKQHGFDALLLYDAANIRYVSSTVAGISAQGSRYCLLPGDNDPIVWEIGCDAGRDLLSAPWLNGRVHHAIPLKYAPVHSAKESADSSACSRRRTRRSAGRRRRAHAENVDGFGVGRHQVQGCFARSSRTRAVKTVDEIECCRQAIALAEPCFDAARAVDAPGRARAGHPGSDGAGSLPVRRRRAGRRRLGRSHQSLIGGAP